MEYENWLEYKTALSEFEKELMDEGAVLSGFGEDFSIKHWNTSNVIEGDKTIYDMYALCCVMVLLYDKDNSRASIVHVREPSMAEGLLQNTIERMKNMERKEGSEKILALIAGGNRVEVKGTSRTDRKAIHSLIESKKTVRANANILKLVWKIELTNIEITCMALQIKTGVVKYFAAKATQKRYVSDEFELR